MYGHDTHRVQNARYLINPVCCTGYELYAMDLRAGGTPLRGSDNPRASGTRIVTVALPSPSTALRLCWVNRLTCLRHVT